MTRLIGYCGVACDRCPAYRATLKGDEAALEAIATEWSSGDRDLSLAEVRCYGCHAGDAYTAAFCTECDVRRCAGTHGFGTCAECRDYPCARLDAPHEASPEARRVLDDLRRRACRP